MLALIDGVRVLLRGTSEICLLYELLDAACTSWGNGSDIGAIIVVKNLASGRKVADYGWLGVPLQMVVKRDPDTAATTVHGNIWEIQPQRVHTSWPSVLNAAPFFA
ncbi:hypothetical protein PAPYR_9864 [Paratrimastix pyriformis]|uniref:Uncharacterized protein n=1 Tax=Paratrimastix pyriformis TaxID=342808 RepID=A0ABQ8UCY9_9EUKA|nr:hypothetical protein PAPYR_9864 [Paratrimastix pyriformis]